MGTSLIRAMLLASAGVAVAVAVVPTAAYAQEATYQIDIPAQSMGDALRALGKSTKQNIVFSGSVVKGKRSAAVRGRMSASDALGQMLAGSGLSLGRGSGGGFTVVKAGNAGAASGSADTSQESGRVVQVPSATASTVVDARTGAALKGALVEIVETGEKTSTGDLGQFRFPGKNGNFNLRISYLGYPEYQQNVDLEDGRATSAIILSDGSAQGEIVVTAYQSARAQALNQERAADNTRTVISDDLMGKFDGTTVADALRRAPGLSFIAAPESGDGQNVMVRGLAPDFNTITVNGVRLPAGNGVDRSPPLNNLLADSISQITINKTLLPSQESSGTGGLIEIETKGPLDRPSGYASLSVDYGKAARGFLDEYAISGTTSWKFGSAENFGLSVSGQFRKRTAASLRLGGLKDFGEYLPQGVSRLSQIDPRSKFPYEEGVEDFYQRSLFVQNIDNDIETASYGVSAQWDVDGSTSLRLDLLRNTAANNQIGRNFNIEVAAGYEPMAISSLGGEVRSALVWENYDGLGLPAYASQAIDINDTKSSTSSISFKGRTSLGRTLLKYAAGYSKSRSYSNIFAAGFGDIDTYYNKTFLPSDLSEDVLSQTINGRIISLFPANAKRVALPSLTSSGLDKLNNNDTYQFSFAQGREYRGQADNLTSSISVRQDFDRSILKYIEVGLNFQRAKSSNDDFGNVVYFGSGSAADFGVGFSQDALDRAGLNSEINTISLQDAYNFVGSVRSGRQPLLNPTLYPDDPNIFSNGLQETKLAGYVEAFAKIGRLDIIGGVRFEKSKARSHELYAPTIINANGSVDTAYSIANTELRDYRGSNVSALPRITFNFRLKENLIARLGYFRSVAPQGIGALNGQTSFFLNLRPRSGPGRDQPSLTISAGNPDLLPATTDNLDFSLEWYFDSVGVIKAGAFYKPTKNSFMTVVRSPASGVLAGIVLPDDPRFQTPNLFIQTTRRENAPDTTKLWGLEFSVERQFDFLPGWFSGFGVYANYTYADGSRTLTDTYSLAPGGVVSLSGIRYSEQVPHSGTLALTYSKSNFAGSLAYTAQSGRYGTSFPRYGISSGANSISTLDLKLQYQAKFYGADMRLYFEGSNLLKGASTPTLSEGNKSSGLGEIINTSENYLGGRVFRLGLSISL